MDTDATEGRHRVAETAAPGAAGGLSAAQLERHDREEQGVRESVGAPPLEPARQQQVCAHAQSPVLRPA